MNAIANQNVSAAATENVRDELLAALTVTDRALRVTRLAHWNVQGPQFFALHAAFEEQYNDLAEAVDELAERITALGALVPDFFAGQEAQAVTSDATELTKAAASAHRLAAEQFRSGLAVAAEAGDDVTEGLFAERLAVHEKTLWMLEASLA